jgi:hypothetical protein
MPDDAPVFPTAGFPESWTAALADVAGAGAGVLAQPNSKIARPEIAATRADGRRMGTAPWVKSVAQLDCEPSIKA